MITPSFSPTATERVLPKLALDFTTGVLDNRVTFTRTTDATHPATYTNANGAIVAATNNQPRFDYNNGVCQGLLIEESRTNFLVNSILDGAVVGSPGTQPTGWTQGSATGSIAGITASSYASGYAIEISCSTQRCGFYQSVSVSANTTYCFSLDVEVISNPVSLYQYIYPTLLPSGATVTYLRNNVSVAGSVVLSLGKQRITVVAAIGATPGTPNLQIGAGIQGNVTTDCKISNVQAEVGAFPTSYIPTTTTALTRNADVATMTGSNFSDWYNATQGTFSCRATRQGNGTYLSLFSANNGTSTQNIEIFSYTNQDLEGVVANSGTQANPYTAGNLFTAGTTKTVTFSYAANNFYAAQNGVAFPSGNPDVSGSVPTVNQLQIGSAAGNQRQGFWLVKLYYYPQALTRNEVLAVSSYS